MIYLKNPQSVRYNNWVEVSLDIILLSESQLIIEDDFNDVKDKNYNYKGKKQNVNYQMLNNNFKSKNLRYVAIFNTLFKYPIYGILTDEYEFKVFINQPFRDKNDYNLKNLLMSIFEFVSDVLMKKNELNQNSKDQDSDEDDELEIKLYIYMKRRHFETESKLLIKNLSWLGGKLILDDKDQTNKFNDWYIMEFEV